MILNIHLFSPKLLVNLELLSNNRVLRLKTFFFILNFLSQTHHDPTIIKFSRFLLNFLPLFAPCMKTKMVNFHLRRKLTKKFLKASESAAATLLTTTMSRNIWRIDITILRDNMRHSLINRLSDPKQSAEMSEYKQIQSSQDKVQS